MTYLDSIKIVRETKHRKMASTMRPKVEGTQEPSTTNDMDFQGMGQVKVNVPTSLNVPIPNEKVPPTPPPMSVYTNTHRSRADKDGQMSPKHGSVSKGGNAKERLRMTLGSLKPSVHARTGSESLLPKLKNTGMAGNTSGNTSNNTTGFNLNDTNNSFNHGKETYSKRTVNSVADLAMTLNINHPDSRFMINVSKDQKNLQAFVGYGQRLVGEKKVTNVATRNKFWEGNSAQLINNSIKKQMNFLKDDRALDILQDAMEKSHARDIRILELQAKDVMEELNKVHEGNKLKKVQKEQMKVVLQDLQANNDQLLVNKTRSVEELAKDIEKLEAEFIVQKQSRSRMDKIIDICKINLIQNEDWLRGLEIYINNLNHCLKIQSNKNRQHELNKEMTESEYKKIRHIYNLGIKTHKNVLDDMTEAIEDFKHLKVDMYNTAEVVQSAVEARNNEICSTLISKKELKQKENSLIHHQIKQKQVQAELEKAMIEHNKFAHIFAPGLDGEDWEKKPKMAKAIKDFERFSELTMGYMQRESRVSIAKEKTMVIQEKIDVVLS